MSRLEGFLRVLVVVTATVLTSEWIHYRLGDPGIFRMLQAKSPSLRGIDDGSDDASVTESEVETYLAVLEAQQTNHDLSIEDALAARNLSLDRFRDIEQRVQRNPLIVERVREHLRDHAEALWRQRGEPLETARRSTQPNPTP